MPRQLYIGYDLVVNTDDCRVRSMVQQYGDGMAQLDPEF